MDVRDLSLQTDSRPYRSHKVPACNSCRQRKIRCEIDNSNQACRLCRKRQTRCEISRTKHDNIGKGQTRRRSQAVDLALPTAASTSGNIVTGRDQFTSPEECSTVIANPTMAEDIELLEAYITSQVTVDLSRVRYGNRVSNPPSEPILYLPVPQRRPRLSPPGLVAGREQREIMDQILGPVNEAVIQL
jgi:hypothetical protein